MKFFAHAVLVLALGFSFQNADAKAKKKAVEAAVVDESAQDESLNAKLVAGDESKTAEVKTDVKSDAKASADSAAAAQDVGADASTAIANTEAAPVLTPEAAKKAELAKLPEDQIPVLAAAKDPKKSEGNPFFRILTTLGVLAVTLGAAAYGLKKFAARTAGKKNQSAQIRVLTTHHLGPKKNLQIVQVAGETILIGVTDHNITMLKTLALIDDEVPADMPQKFNHSMEDFADEEDEPIAMRGLDQIRDTVSARLRNMRNL